MDEILFMDKKHELFFYQMLNRCSVIDIYRIVFFYTMGLTNETREHITSLYDFENCCINPEAAKAPWQTSTTRKVCNLAYNLYGGYYDEDYAAQYTPSYLFCSPLAEYFFVAIRLLLESICL